MRSITCRSSASLLKRTSVWVSRPPRSIQTGRGAANHQLVDAPIAQQRLQRSQPDGALAHARGQLRPRRGIEHARLALHQRVDPHRRVIADAGLARAVDQAVAQRPGQRVEGVR